MDLRVGKNYQLVRKIGSGAFGDIYEGILRHPNTFVRETHADQRISCY